MSHLNLNSNENGSRSRFFSALDSTEYESELGYFIKFDIFVFN